MRITHDKLRTFVSSPWTRIRPPLRVGHRSCFGWVKGGSRGSGQHAAPKSFRCSILRCLDWNFSKRGFWPCIVSISKCKEGNACSLCKRYPSCSMKKTEKQQHASNIISITYLYIFITCAHRIIQMKLQYGYPWMKDGWYWYGIGRFLMVCGRVWVSFVSDIYQVND